MENFILCAVELLKAVIMAGKHCYRLFLVAKMPAFSENLKNLLTEIYFYDNLPCYGYMNHESITNLWKERFQKQFCLFCLILVFV